MVTIRKLARIAITLLVSLMLIQFATKSAEAGHRHFHHHRGFHVGWSGFRSFGGYAGYRPWGWHHAWNYRPVYVQRYYYAPYYYTPYSYTPYSCFGWGGYGALNFGYRSTWIASNRQQIPATTSEALRHEVAEDALNDERLTDRLSKIALRLEVPADARVYINGSETTSAGGERSYVVPGASMSERYDFVVRAEVERDGVLITKSKTVRLRGGQSSLLSFELNVPQTQVAMANRDPIETMLKVRVPDRAKVFLSGNETRQTGEERVFVTKSLRAGEMWEDYSIRVAWDEDGREHSREKRITLVAGETRELEFGDESNLVAAVPTK